MKVYEQTKRGTENEGKPGEFSFEFSGWGIANADGSAPAGENVISTGNSFEVSTVEDAMAAFGLTLEAVLSAVVNAANAKRRVAAAQPYKLGAKLAGASDEDRAKARQKALALLAALDAK